VPAGICLGAVLFYLQPPTPWLRKGTIHVSPTGFDGWPGSSRRLAVRTIQHAVDRATAGETILIWPGVYRETIHVRRGGRPGHPLVLRAAIPGWAVISGTAEPTVTARWRWRSLGGHRHAARIPWRVDGLRVDGVMAYRSRSSGHLRAICPREGAWPAFHASNGELILCLPDGRAPKDLRLEVNRPLPARLRSGGHQVASVWIEAPHVEVRDLVFDFPVMAAIQLWNTSNVRIVGNRFNGADVAINDSPNVRKVTNLAVEHNLSHCYPLYEWVRHGWLTWGEVYPYSNCALTWVKGRNVHIEGNIITQAGDGIKVSPVGGENVVTRNLIAFSTDDAFEFDGPAVNLTVRSNLVVDAWVGLGISPVTQGPLHISDNIFLASPQSPEHGNGVLLKLMGGPIRNVSVSNNLFVGYQLGWSVEDSPLQDFSMTSNTLATVQSDAVGMFHRPQMRWQGNRVALFSRFDWPRPEQGPAALLPLVGPAAPLRLGPLGPLWFKPGQDVATRALLPLLRSGWMVEAP
jgi:hypothetical protein